MKILLLLFLLYSLSLAKNDLQKFAKGGQTIIIVFFYNNITFDEFQEMWISIENEKQDEKLCVFLPTAKEGYYSCDVQKNMQHIFDNSKYDADYDGFLNQARANVETRCDEWKDSRDQNLILLTNYGNKTKYIINEIENVIKEKCDLGELPFKWMLYSLLIFIGLAAITATVFHQWRKSQERKNCYKLKFALGMAGNLGPDEIKKIESLWDKMLIENKFIEVKQSVRGRGSSSVVYDAFLHTKTPVIQMHPCQETKKFQHCTAVIKVANNFGQDEFKNVLKEVTVALKTGWHKNICCVLGWTFYMEKYCLIYECLDGGDLLSWIKRFPNNQTLVTERQFAEIFWQIADGMEYLSALGIVHKDLAARNILITKKFEIKISDFGLSSFCGVDYLYHAPANQKLPVRWMAVECFCEEVFSEASDVWSFGVVIWELLTFGQIPYGKMSNVEIVKFIVNENRLTLPASAGEPWQMLTHDCWKQDRSKRPTFNAIRILLGKYLKENKVDYGYCSFDKCAIQIDEENV